MEELSSVFVHKRADCPIHGALDSSYVQCKSGDLHFVISSDRGCYLVVRSYSVNCPLQRGGLSTRTIHGQKYWRLLDDPQHRSFRTLEARDIHSYYCPTCAWPVMVAKRSEVDRFGSVLAVELSAAIGLSGSKMLGAADGLDVDIVLYGQSNTHTDPRPLVQRTARAFGATPHTSWRRMHLGRTTICLQLRRRFLASLAGLWTLATSSERSIHSFFRVVDASKSYWFPAEYRCISVGDSAWGTSEIRLISTQPGHCGLFADGDVISAYVRISSRNGRILLVDPQRPRIEAL